jgi:hypothetical protein
MLLAVKTDDRPGKGQTVRDPALMRRFLQPPARMEQGEEIERQFQQNKRDCLK